MRGRIRFALAIASALACAASTVQAAEKTPWELVKELFQKPIKKTERRIHPAKPKAGSPDGSPAATDAAKDVSGVSEVAVPIPRPRPQRETAKIRTPDFDASFVPPPVLKIPTGRQPAQVQLLPPAAEPEQIPLGPPDAGDHRQAAFPFPIPRPKPQGPGVEPLAMLPEDQPSATGGRPAMREIGSCMTELAALGVEADPVAPVAEDACAIATPASVASFENGAVKLPVKAMVNCEMARTTAGWLRDVVQPEAVASLGGRVTGLRIAASYDCRTRDHIAGAKLSEHAYGNAIDFAAFRVKGRWIEVGGDHAADEQAFIDAIRTKACGPFKTVLGPGSDRFHVDHLHLDLAKRRTAGPSKGLYCK